MERRKFIKKAVAVVAAGTASLATASSLATPAIAQGKRRLKMVTTWPKDFPGLGTAAQRLAGRISDMSAGELTVKVFAAGELVPAFESFAAVSGGAADMYHAAEYYWQDKSKAFNFFTTVPFGLTAAEMNAWLYHGGGQELWDELSAGFNLKPFATGNTGVQMGGWFNKEIHGPKDLKGLKIRMPGLGGEVMRRIGAAAVNLPAGEIFPALQSGAIDATEWVGPWNDLAFGFYKVAKFYYYPGFHEPGSTISAAVNLKVWNGLSAEHQAIITSATAAENVYTLAEFNARNNDALDILRTKHGVELRKFSDRTLEVIGAAAGKVVAEAGNGDVITGKVFASMIAFRKSAIAWSKLSEQAFLNARLLPFRYG